MCCCAEHQWCYVQQAGLTLTAWVQSWFRGTGMEDLSVSHLTAQYVTTGRVDQFHLEQNVEKREDLLHLQEPALEKEMPVGTFAHSYAL